MHYLLQYKYTAHSLLLFLYAIVDFYLVYDRAVDMQGWAFHTRSHCRVSDIQLTVKALALFVNNGAETPKGKKKWNAYFIIYKARINDKQDVFVKHKCPR